MLEQNEYLNLSKEELLVKEIALKKNRIIALIVCFLAVCSVLVNIYLKKSNGAFVVFLILTSLFLTGKYSTSLKEVQNELKNRTIL